MDMRTDDRGKFFTPRIAKESVAAAIRTSEHLIVGLMHVHPDKRLKDELNHPPDRFIAITEACVHNADGSEMLFESSFLLVEASHIIFITPLETVKDSERLPWAHRQKEPA